MSRMRVLCAVLLLGLGGTAWGHCGTPIGCGPSGCPAPIRSEEQTFYSQTNKGRDLEQKLTIATLVVIGVFGVGTVAYFIRDTRMALAPRRLEPWELD